MFSINTTICKSQSNLKKSETPNVLFIAVDDLNNWLGCLNNYSNTKTPNMDRLAAMGVLFSNAHCQAPLCGPSRASIMSGLRPSTTGIYGMISDEKIRNTENPATKDITFLPEYFKNNGYYTMGIGKLFHDYAPKGVFDDEGDREKGFGPYPENRLFGMVLAQEIKRSTGVQAPIGAHSLNVTTKCQTINRQIGLLNV